jgi:hypothetical protein
MDRPASQLFLRVISIIDIALGILSVVAGVVALSGGTFLGTGSGRVATEAAAAMDVTIIGGTYSLLGVLALLAGLLAITEGVLGLRAARDTSRIMPVWVISLVGLVFGIVDLAIVVSQQADMTAAVIDLMAAALLFWVVNDIRTKQ